MPDETPALPNPETLRLESHPGINPDLIHEMIQTDRIDYLVSLFDSIQRAKHRAEALAQIYFNQMEILHQRLETLKAGELPGLNARPNPKGKQRPETSGGKSLKEAIELGKPQKSTAMALDLDI